MRSNLDYEAEYIEGFVENIIYRNEDNGYTVFNVVYKGEEITCVGVFSYINAGEFIAANGGFVKHPSYDMQFSIKSYEFKAPDDTKSVRRYLASGAIKGIGEKMAERIVKEFGDDTFRIMEEEPERLAEIKGISLTTVSYTHLLRSFDKSTNSLPSHFTIGRDRACSLIKTTSPVRPSESLTLFPI